MINPLLKRFAWPMACAFVAMAGGVAGGSAATSELRLNSYGSDAPPKIIEASARPWHGDCSDCSERAQDYHWATMREIRSVIDCPQDSWNFQRGCRDYVRDPAT